jgi:putative transposase
MDQYAWSSHRGYLSDAQKWEWLHKDFVLGMLARYKAAQIRKYRQFVETSDSEELISVFEKANLPPMLGGRKFIEWVKEVFFKGEIEKDVPQSKTLVPGKHTIIKVICGFYAVTEKELVRMRRGIRNKPRDMAIYLFRTVCGEPLMHIGHEFGMMRYSSVSSAVDRIKRHRQNDSKFEKRINVLMDLINKGQTET